MRRTFKVLSGLLSYPTAELQAAVPQLTATIDREAPLPILRVKFGDPEKTWAYIDPSVSQIVRTVQWKGRIERWIYHGFHSLDFRFLYYRRPEWDVVMIVLSLGGATTSLIGMIVGFRRVFRGAKRTTKVYSAG